MIVVLELFLAFVFEKRDGLQHDLPGSGIEVFKGFIFRVQQHVGAPCFYGR
jgi:hypothetical protein